MICPLSIVSLDQGKIARRYDFELKPGDESGILAASKTETKDAIHPIL